jgi:hypothetical protein
MATLRIITAFATEGAEYYRSYGDRSMSPAQPWAKIGSADRLSLASPNVIFLLTKVP